MVATTGKAGGGFGGAGTVGGRRRAPVRAGRDRLPGFGRFAAAPRGLDGTKILSYRWRAWSNMTYPRNPKRRLRFDGYALDLVSRASVVQKLTAAGVELAVALEAVNLSDA